MSLQKKKKIKKESIGIWPFNIVYTRPRGYYVRAGRAKHTVHMCQGTWESEAADTLKELNALLSLLLCGFFLSFISGK